jgi:transposase
MIRLVFSNETRERLRHERLHHPHPRVRQRLEALYLKSAGWSHQAICASVGITKPTLIGYLRLYQAGGWAALTSCRFRQARSALARYEGVIAAAFARRPPATLVEASARIAELTGIERSPAQVGKVLEQFGLRRRKTGAIPGPALTAERRAEQARFEAEVLTPRLEEAQAGRREVFFWTPPTSSTASS